MVNVATAAWHLAPTGVLCATANLINMLLIVPQQLPATAVAPALAMVVATCLGLLVELVPYTYLHLIYYAAKVWLVGGNQRRDREILCCLQQIRNLPRGLTSR